MSTKSVAPTVEKASVSAEPSRPGFSYCLLIIALAALVPMLVLGASRSISYDGYWHLFIASQYRWKQFLFEYKANAHPLVYFLALRVIQFLGHSRLVLRSGAIVPGAAAVYLIGLIAARLCRSRIVALLAAATYGFATVMIEIEIDVRSYSLCLFFALTAFYFLIDFLERDFTPPAERSLLLFGVFASGAIATEYYAVFFLLACLAALPVVLLKETEVRQRAVRWIVANWGAALVAMALPFATTTYFYLTHIRHQPLEYGHLSGFYYTVGSSRAEFILFNLRADLNYILPFEITSTNILLAALALIVPAILIFAFYRGLPVRNFFAGLPGLISLFIVVELIVVSLLGRYPFGGFERQQSILFPFFILATFVLLDSLVSYLRAAWLRAAVLTIVALSIAASFEYRWQRTPRDSEELFSREYQTFENTVAHPDAVYLDQFTIIGFYIHTHAWKWKLDRHFREPDRIDECRLTSPSGEKMFLLRDIDQWNFDLHNPQIYQTLANSLRDAQLTSASMFLLKQVQGPATPEALLTEQTDVRRLAAAAGLHATILHDDPAQAEISFSK